MKKVLGWAGAMLLAAAGAAWAQACPNCGNYHGGAPSSGKMSAEADKKAAEIDALLKPFHEKERASREAYQKGAKEVIAKIEVEQQARKAAIAAARREEIINRKGAEAMKKIEGAQKPGAAPLSPQERGAAVGEVKTLIGVEAARERMKLKETNTALEQLKRKEANDRPVPGTIEALPPDRIFDALVTPFERAKQKISNIFDNSDIPDPTRE
jgi:hypothetical protein